MAGGIRSCDRRAADQHLCHGVAMSPLSWSPATERDTLGDCNMMPVVNETCAVDESVEYDESATNDTEPSEDMAIGGHGRDLG